MAYRHRELGFLVKWRKDGAERIIREAYRDSGGLLEQAAIDLNVSPRTLQRYVRQLRIWDASGRCLTEADSSESEALDEID